MTVRRGRSIPDTELRPYQASDLQALVELDRICFSETFRFSKRAMREFAEAAQAISVVAHTVGSGSLVGFVIIHVAIADQSIHAYVVTLDVHPANGRSGVGSVLLREAENLAAEAGAIQIGLHVHTENVGAISFYQAHNFKQQVRLRDFYGPGRDAFFYSRELNVGDP